MGFTVMNGEDAEYNGGLALTDSVTPFDKAISGGFSAVLSKLGLLELFRIIYNVIYYWIGLIK